MVYRSLGILLLMMLALPLLSQRTIVSGTVYDAETEQPLPFVNISYKDSKIGTTTDVNGKYRIETYYATDSLLVSYVGYKRLAREVEPDVEQTVDFYLEPSSVQMEEVVVSAKDAVNPADMILDRIIENKEANNREKLDAYEYETYNKIQFDLNNFTENFTQKRIFKEFDFIFDYVDSSDKKVALPIFMTESISDFYYRRQPKKRREVIHASKVSGINNESISQFLGQMYQDVNVYENSVTVFEKNFISPIADYGRTFYKYYLTDSAYIENKWCYKLKFVPRNEYDLTFDGHFWVNDTTYAIKRLDAEIGGKSNLNFISSMWVRHEYKEVQHEVWMLTREQLVVDFNLREEGAGVYGRKTTTYEDFVINEPRDLEFFSGPEKVVVESKVNTKDSEYWQKQRHEQLTSKQSNVYQMVDSLKKTPKFVTYVDIVNFIFTGYKEVGNWEFGPVWSVLSWNTVEGYRVRLGGRTSNQFSTNVMLESYLAYGFTDERWKYSLGGQWFLSKKPRHSVGAYYTEDLELLGQEYNLLPRDHIFTSIFRRNPQDRLTYVREARLYTEREWFNGFSTRIEFQRREMSAEGNWTYERPNPEGSEPQPVDDITTSEIGLGVRFAYQEKFVSGEFERVSLGTKWPILEVDYRVGVNDLIGGDYDYHKLKVQLSDDLPLGPFGRIELSATGGVLWDPVPYPLLFIHPGNETIFRNSKAFNTMNFFEFVSDRFIQGKAEYHLDGLLFNRVPLFRKLKLREVVGMNIAFGSFDKDNEQELLLPDRTFVLNDRPYIEAFVGVENILKIFRVDVAWRFSYLDNPNVNRLAILLGYELQF